MTTHKICGMIHIYKVWSIPHIVERIKPLSAFTSGELEVMQALWEHGKMKPAEIQEKFPRPIKNAALRSVLLVLLAKGHVTRVKRGKAYFYSAKTPRQRTLKQMVKDLAETFCGGSSTALIVQLIKMEKLSEKEILELQKIAYQENKGKDGKS